MPREGPKPQPVAFGGVKYIPLKHFFGVVVDYFPKSEANDSCVEAEILPAPLALVFAFACSRLTPSEVAVSYWHSHCLSANLDSSVSAT